MTATKDAPPRIAIGAHCSASGGLWRTIERAAEIEAEAVQFFGASPRAWRPTNHKPEAYERFRALRAESGIGQAWLHGSYLVSLAARSEEQHEKSIASVVNALSVAARAGADGVVLHSGSHLGRGFEAVLPEVVSALARIFDEAPEGPLLALENAAGQQGPIGGRFEELGAILGAADSPRLRVCLDTCHTFAAGYDITTPEGMADTIEEFDREIGLDLLAVIHANDSKQEAGQWAGSPRKYRRRPHRLRGLPHDPRRARVRRPRAAARGAGHRGRRPRSGEHPAAEASARRGGGGVIALRGRQCSKVG